MTENIKAKCDLENGQWAHDLATKLWPINRSLTGEGVRQTLDILEAHMPCLSRYQTPTGSRVFDWTVPKEWQIKQAWIKTPSGEKICEFSKNNLHLVGYSEPVNKIIDLASLQKHLYSLPAQPTAIPYVTSYYKETWGFCISEEQRKSLVEGEYHVFIDSELKNGVLDYADLIIPGVSEEEIVFSTYICHPSMANNELSGPVVAAALANFVNEKKNRKYTYRFIFVPETIGSIVYLSEHLDDLKQNVKAGFVLTCLGDEGNFSYLASPFGDNYADKLATAILCDNAYNYKSYSFLERGSDERQYCSPSVNLPFCSIMKTKYGEFPEYHTSLDDLKLVTAVGLGQSIQLYKELIELIEKNCHPQASHHCEPQLGKRGLYNSISTVGSGLTSRGLTNFLAYANGELDLIDISKSIRKPLSETIELFDLLKCHDLIINK